MRIRPILQERHILRRTLRLSFLAVGIAALGSVFLTTPGVVRATSPVTVTVKAPDGTTPVMNAQVNVWGPSGAGGNTDSTGAINVTLSPGHYTAQAIPPTGSSYAQSNPTEFDVFEGQAASITLTFLNLQMKGKFQKSDGTGVRGSLDVHNADYSKNVHIESDQNGNYGFGGMTAGTYTVQTRPGYDVTGLVAPDPIDVTLADSSVAIYNFTLTPSTKTLTGKVTRADGSAVTDACINVNKMTGQGFSSTNVNGSGDYALSLSGGSWSVQPNPCSPTADWIYSGNPVQMDFANDATVEVKTLNLTVTRAGASISGAVTDTNGAAIANGGIDFRTSGGTGAHAQTNNAGVFSVRLAGGTYDVFFWTSSNAYSLPATQITVGDDESKTLNLVVRGKNAHIKGTVKDANGAAAANVMINAWEMTNSPGGKPGSWGNTRSAPDGTFDMLVNAGTYGVNIGTEPNSTYVWANQKQIQVTLSTETSIVTAADNPDLNFVVAKADATITGRLTVGGQPLGQFNGCVFARPAGANNQPCGPLQPNGTFTIRVSSAGGTAFELGCSSGPNTQYSCGTPVGVTVVTGGTVTKDFDLTANNSAISGQLYDVSGFPLKNCDAFKGGMVFADSPSGNGSHYQGQITPSCGFSISLVAGVYNLNSFFPPESGCMNAPPGKPVQVFNGQTVQKNLQCVKADATITVKLLDQNGNGTQGFINVDNNDEINMSREGNRAPSGNSPADKGANIGFNKPFPCNAKPDDFSAVMKCCSDAKNKPACTAFDVPDGPGGCKNLWTCTQQCAKNPASCKDAKRNDQPSGPQPGKGQGNFTGPGGCKSDAECQKYCSDQSHFNECSKFKPPAAAQSVKRVISSRGVTAAEVSKVVVNSTGEDNGPGFNQGIHTGGPTDQQGNTTIQLLSGHQYKVCAGLPPESDAMPPKCQSVDLTSAKTASVTLQLRQADAKLTGTVKMPNGTPATRCFVHAWAEDGSFSGQPCSGSGTYKINLTADTTWHIGADSMSNTKFYRSDESLLVVVRGTKSYTQAIALQEQDFEIPQPVTVSGDCSSPLVIGLSNGTKITVPAGALSTSTTGQCSCTASPTIDLLSTRSTQPQGTGYTVDCRDDTNAQVTKLKSSATVVVPYKLPKNQEGTSTEDAIKPVFYNTTSGAYESLTSYTQDKDKNTLTFSVDHFSAYAVANTSGVSSKNAALSTVTAKKGKDGKTKITVGKASATPFNSKCDVAVVTKGVNGTQLIAASATCESDVKVYDTKLKLKATIKTGWTGVNSSAFDDVTRDGLPDIVLAPIKGKEVWVVNAGKKFAVTKLSVSSKPVMLTAAPMDFSGSGLDNLVTATVTKSKAEGFQIYSYSKKGFGLSTSTYASYLVDNKGAIGLNIGAPSVTKVSPAAGSAKSKTVKVSLTGKNFTADSQVLAGTVSAKIKVKSVTQIDLTIDGTKLGAGKYAVKVSNPGGKSTTAKTKLVLK